MIEIVAAFIGIVGAIIVWYLSARDLTNKDRANKRREIRLQFLIDAYRKLESASNRPLVPDSDNSRNIETAIADIQLFGTHQQADLARDAAKAFAETSQCSFDPLLDELRNDLREELKLEILQGKRAILRIGKK